MKTACYCRVSSEIQRDANGTDAQRAVIRAWLTGQGLDPAAALWFEDLAVSGKSMDRPGWLAMMAQVRAGTVGTVVLYDLSRAGRTLKGLAGWVEEMVERKTRVVFVKDNIDISTAMGRLILHIIGAIAEYARQENARRISDGVRAKIAGGQQWGSAPILTEAQRVQVRALKEAGATFADLAERFKVSVSTVTRAVHGRRE